MAGLATKQVPMSETRTTAAFCAQRALVLVWEMLALREKAVLPRWRGRP